MIAGESGSNLRAGSTLLDGICSGTQGCKLPVYSFVAFYPECGMKRLVLFVLFFAASCACLAQKPAQNLAKTAPAATYIRAGRLFDATSDSVRENMVIVVEGGRIQSVGPAASVFIPGSAT